MLNHISCFIINTTWVSWLFMGISSLIGVIIADKCGLFRWLDNFGTKNEFLSLRDAIDIFIEYNIKLEDTYEKYSWSALQNVVYQNQLIVDYSLINLLCYINSKALLLYGQKTKSIQNLQPLNLECVIIESWFLKSNWSDDFSSIYKQGDLLYTNLQVKKTDLDNLVEKYKYPCRDVK